MSGCISPDEKFLNLENVFRQRRCVSISPQAKMFERLIAKAVIMWKKGGYEVQNGISGSCLCHTSYDVRAQIVLAASPVPFLFAN